MIAAKNVSLFCAKDGAVGFLLRRAKLYDKARDGMCADAAIIIIIAFSSSSFDWRGRTLAGLGSGLLPLGN